MRIFRNTVVTVVTLFGLFFVGIGIAALALKLDYVTVMNTVFDWFKGLSQ